MTQILIDRRSKPEQVSQLIDEVSQADFIGFDFETHDDNAHAGIKAFRGSNTAKVFDMRRTTVCGFSIYAKDSDKVYYVNMGHADVENRLSWEEVKPILEAKKPSAYWVAHNAPFELTVALLSLGFELGNIICTLQACVSAYGPDDYHWQRFINAGLGEMNKLMPAVAKAFATFDPNKRDLSPRQGEVFGQIAGKTSRASHSYNGHVYELAYGYGLKKAIKSHFNYDMATFDDTLKQANAKHMGQLTGDQVLSYGCDDSYWAVRLFFEKLMPMMAQQNNQLLNTFFTQENPMVHVFADIWANGMRVNTKAVAERRSLERTQAAEILRKLRAALSEFEFPEDPHPKLFKDEKWYNKNFERYRNRILDWIAKGDREDDFEEVSQAAGSVPSGWHAEKGNPNWKGTGPNFTHYMTMRTVMYDLLGQHVIKKMGKIQSDGDARGEMIGRLKDRLAEFVEKSDELYAYIEEHGPGEAEMSEDHALGVEIDSLKKKIHILELFNALAGVEQRMKLYLNPYSMLMDPETGRMYPVVSSKLATRRLASVNPNPMQLAKQGESTYVRGFYEGDTPEHLVVSLDWSQIELVEIGEESGDPEFLRAYGQLPYNDLHRVAAADILAAEQGVELTPEEFADFRNLPDDYDVGFELKDNTGKRLTPKEAYKYNRGTAGGKGANFGYWYSGALGSVATARGISSDLMWQLTDQYRERFKVAEKWRTGVIEEVQKNGFVTLPDGHRRNRFEATAAWAALMGGWFDAWENDGIKKFGEFFIRKMQTRAGNQAVNAKIQGGCATLAKRTILSTIKAIKEAGLRARFLVPIHDELVWSVHKDDVVEFIRLARHHMTHHPDMFKKTVLHCTAAVGRTFEPWHPVKAPYGQVELDEAPAADFTPPDKVNGELNDDEIQAVVDYMARAA